MKKIPRKCLLLIRCYNENKNIQLSKLKEAGLHLYITANQGRGKVQRCEVNRSPFLNDAEDFCSIDKETILLFSSIECNVYTTAEAINYTNLSQELHLRVCIKKNKQMLPTKHYLTTLRPSEGCDLFRNINTFTFLNN
jgi:hypothetical protein